MWGKIDTTFALKLESGGRFITHNMLLQISVIVHYDRENMILRAEKQ